MGKVVVITGGNSGIGKATAELLKNHGHTVVIVSKSIETVQENNEFACDVSVEEQVSEVFGEIGYKFGKIDVLINNAGYGISGATELLPSDSVKRLLEVNVLGVVLCSKYALPFMHRGGKIINLASAMAFFPLPFRTMYAASKSAVVTISHGMGLELKSAGINVCAVCPGDVKTNFTKNRIKHFDTNEKYGNRIEKATNSLDEKEDKRMSVSVVARKLLICVNRSKNSPTVIIGAKYKILYIAQKLLPTKLILWFIGRFFSGK